MRNAIVLRGMAVAFAAAFALYGEACTNLIVGKKASADGSVMVSYSADDFGSFGYLRHFPAAEHAKGATRFIYDWETNNYLGEKKFLMKFSSLSCCRRTAAVDRTGGGAGLASNVVNRSVGIGAYP